MALLRRCQEPVLDLKHLNESVALIDALPYLLKLILLEISEETSLLRVHDLTWTELRPRSSRNRG